MAASDITGAPREDLIAMVQALVEENEALRVRVAELERRVRRLSGPPPSAPSSQRPVWDKPAPKPEAKPPGQKRGHAGMTRERPERIDQTIIHGECSCPACGSELVDVEEREQIVEEIVPAHTEAHRHVWLRGRCPKCHAVRDLRPPEVRKGAHLGTATLLLAAWMKTHLGLPFRKASEALLAFAGLRVSPGGLSQSVKSLARDFAAEIEAIEKALRKEPSVNADETGLRVSGKANWLWAFVTPRLARFRAERRRGGEVVRQVLGEGFSGVLGCDFYRAHNAMTCPKQRCLAHLLREIKTVLDRRGPGRPPPAFLLAARRWCQAALFVGQCWENFTLSTAVEYRRRIERRLDGLLAMRTRDKEARRLQTRLRLHAGELTTFLWWHGVDGTNNRAERAIRPAVITRKISGGHRSEAGAQAVAGVTSVLRTCALQGRDFVQAGLEIVRRRHLRISQPVLA
jgi:transposase